MWQPHSRSMSPGGSLGPWGTRRLVETSSPALPRSPCVPCSNASEHSEDHPFATEETGTKRPSLLLKAFQAE